ncbi:DUF1214 domain-containing protein [Desulfosediminicola sp.]|uniref:DUF1214 domain-containing protein n=1 Tax=Desulfosediminicola sp. TaxID=2886825 RepID=UPI003AF2093C
MTTNPPAPEDNDIVDGMARIGQIEMALFLKKQKTTNGWLCFTKRVGNFDTDYLLRAMANLLGPGWNRPADAVYPLSQKDGDANKYDGSRYNYVIHFEKGQLPPVDGFWTLTMYDKDLFLAPNQIDRYYLSQSDDFIYNQDESVDFDLQAESPGKDKKANWLPAPRDTFSLCLRGYWPSDTSPSILDGSWQPPPVLKVSKGKE